MQAIWKNDKKFQTSYEINRTNKNKGDVNNSLVFACQECECFKSKLLLQKERRSD